MMLEILSAGALFMAAALLPLTPASAQALATLTMFTGGNGYAPYGSLILDRAGNLSAPTVNGGLTSNGKPSFEGLVFELVP